MGRITLGQAAAWCGGTVEPKYADTVFFGGNNDSRTIRPGQLFIALQGARDGHDFIPAALEKGAAAVLCSHCDGDYPAIVVEDPRLALGQIARQERLSMGMTVVGVTGSVGKSTTKEMIACALEGQFRVGKTPVNHNNDIGMPMAILGMEEGTQVAVLEMGMNHFREMAYLSSIAMPDLAVIVNIGTMHIEHLGSMEGILKAKLEILEGMKPEGTVILNGDDPLLWGQDQTSREHTVYFGFRNENCGIRGECLPGGDGLRFRVKGGEKELTVEMALEGEHFLPDALAAVSVALELGVPPEKIRENLRSFRNMEGRQEIFEKDGFTIIKDCYNAGPESMLAALKVLGAKPGRHIAVLGDMLELGKTTQVEHYKLGRLAAENADILLCYGPNSHRVLYGAVTGGMNTRNAQAFTDREKLAAVLRSLARPGDVILFKGSHGMHMELALESFFSGDN